MSSFCAHCRSGSTVPFVETLLFQADNGKNKETSLSIRTALERIFEGPILKTGHDGTSENWSMCRKCVETLTSLLKAYQEFLKLRHDLSETTKLFKRIDQRNKKFKTRTVWTNTVCQYQSQPQPILLVVAPAAAPQINSGIQLHQIPTTTTTTISIPEPVSMQIPPDIETIKTTTEISARSEKNQNHRRITRSGPSPAGRKALRNLRSIKKKWPELKELSINLERCDNVLGPGGKVSFIDIKEEESEDEAKSSKESKPEVIFDVDFLIVPNPAEETEINDDPIWVPVEEDNDFDNFEHAADMDVDNNDASNDKSIQPIPIDNTKAGKGKVRVKNKTTRKKRDAARKYVFQFKDIEDADKAIKPISTGNTKAKAVKVPVKSKTIGPLQCRCSEILPNPKVFFEHVIQFHPEEIKNPSKETIWDGDRKMHKCELCDVIYTKFQTLHRHIKNCHCLGSNNPSSSWDSSLNEVFKNQQALVEALVPVLPPINFNRKRKKGRRQRGFPCTFENCKKSFNTKLSLQIHIGHKHRSRETALQCLSCPETFPTSKAFMSHVVESHPEMVQRRQPFHGEKTQDCKIECSICTLKFSSNCGLRGHLRRVHCNFQTETHKCPWEGCARAFFTTSAMGKHVKNYHERNGEKFVCNLCGAVFLYEPNLQRHLKNTRAHGTAILFKCEQCPSEYTTKATWQSHMEKSHGAEIIRRSRQVYTCGSVSRRNRSENSRTTSAAEKLDSISQSCPICSEEFSCLRDLEVHVRNDHRTDPPPEIYICRHSGCVKKFKEWSALVRHKESHLEPKLSCSFPNCERKFRHLCNLKTHLETHKEQRERKESTFLCDICPKTFTSKVLLRQHIKCVHEKMKLKKTCNFPGCGKIVDATNLKRHLQVHEGNREPTFPCDVCGKLFVSSTGVYQHKRFIHDNHPWPRKKKKTEETTTADLSTEDGNESQQGPYF